MNRRNSRNQHQLSRLTRTLVASAISLALPAMVAASPDRPAIESSQVFEIPLVQDFLIAAANTQYSEQEALNKYYDNGYNSCDAKVLAAYWGETEPGDVKIQLGEKMLRFGSTAAHPVMAQARTEALQLPESDLPCSYEDEYTYSDVILLAKYWNNRSKEDAKLKIATMLVAGRAPEITQDLDTAKKPPKLSQKQTPTTQTTSTTPGTRTSPATTSKSSAVAQSAALTFDQIVGRYNRLPTETSWHAGNIKQTGSTLQWVNQGGASWSLTPDLANNRLMTGTENPYFKIGMKSFDLIVTNGRVEGFKFGNDIYVRTQQVVQNPVVPAVSGTTLQQTFNFQGDPTGVTAVTFSPDDRYIVSGGWDNTVNYWDAKTGKLVSTINLKGKGDLVLDVAFSPDGTRVATGNRSYETRYNTVNVFSVGTGKEAYSLNRVPPDICQSVAFSPDGKTIASGCFDSKNGDRTLQLWDANSGKATTTIHDISSPVSFTKDSSIVMGTNSSQKLTFWDARSGKQTGSLDGFAILASDLNPDNSRIAGGGLEGQLKVWDVIDGKELVKFKGHKDNINSIAFNPRGDRIISGSKDSSLRLWDSNTGKQLSSFKSSGTVESVAFNTAGDQVVIGSMGGIINVFSIK